MLKLAWWLICSMLPCNIKAAHRLAAGTISWNFITPVVREFCLMHGMCDVRRDTMVELLSLPGRAVMVAIGGASEALLAAPGTMNLILNKRYCPYPLSHVPLPLFVSLYSVHMQDNTPCLIWPCSQQCMSCHASGEIYQCLHS